MSSWRNSSYGDDDPPRVNLPPIERLDGGKFNRSHHDVPLPPIDCDPFSTREISELPSLPPLSDYLARRSDFSERYSACSIKSKLQLPKCTSFYERSGSSDSDEEHFRHPLDLDSNLRLPPIMLDLKFEQPDPLHVLYNSTPLAVQKNPKRGEYCDTYRPDMYSTCLYHKKNMTDYQDELQGMEKLAQKLADQRLSSTKVDSFHLVSNESIESGVCMSQDTWGSHRMINGLSDSTCIEEVLSRKRSWDQEYRQTEPAGASDQWSRDRRHSIATMSSPSSPIPNSSLPKKPHMISTRDIKMHTETSLSSNIQPLTLVSPDSTHFPDTLECLNNSLLYNLKMANTLTMEVSSATLPLVNNLL
ncbi:hypothetical protein K7432_002929 [Basidiobolus ranarum]|uniref:Uncharacterized protein n=1 Tax=Basidiobolus ranarum TaxID=34480 RepID=A0ABR2X0P9_9FUNG